MSQIFIELPNGERRMHRITDRMRGRPDILIRELRERGLEAAKPVGAVAHPPDAAWVNELMQALGGPPTEKWEPLDVPPQQVRLSVTVTMAEPYFRVVAKVAFHYTLKIFPELTGREREFNRVRNYIWSGVGGGLDRPVKPMDRQFWGSFRRGERPKCWTHLLTVERAHDGLTACVQLFAGPEVLPFPFFGSTRGRSDSNRGTPAAAGSRLYGCAS
jgi:hypothetical protein